MIAKTNAQWVDLLSTIEKNNNRFGIPNATERSVICKAPMGMKSSVMAWSQMLIKLVSWQVINSWYFWKFLISVYMFSVQVFLRFVLAFFWVTSAFSSKTQFQEREKVNFGCLENSRNFFSFIYCYFWSYIVVIWKKHPFWRNINIW